MDRNRNETIKKWYTKLEIVDTDSGEILTKNDIINKKYIIINKNIKYEINKEQQYGTRIILWECERNKQQRLFD